MANDLTRPEVRIFADELKTLLYSSETDQDIEILVKLIEK